MCNTSISAAWQIPCDRTAKLVLVNLADHKNSNTGLCCPSIPTIASECGLSLKGVIIQIKKLEERKVLTVSRSQGRFNHYQLMLQLDQPVNGVHYPPVNGAAKPVNGAAKPVNGVHPNQKNPSTRGGGNPPCIADGEFLRWETDLNRMFPEELANLEKDLCRCLRGVVTQEAGNEWRRRIAAIHRKRFGGIVPEEKNKNRLGAAAPLVRLQEREVSPDELLEGARWAMAHGKGNLMNEEQRRML